MEATFHQKPVPLAQSVRPVVPNASDVDTLEYMMDAFDNCISHMLLMPSPMQTFFRIRLYNKMFTDFAPQEFASSPISTLDDLSVAAPAALRVLALHRPPHETF